MPSRFWNFSESCLSQAAAFYVAGRKKTNFWFDALGVRRYNAPPQKL